VVHDSMRARLSQNGAAGSAGFWESLQGFLERRRCQKFKSLF